MSNDKHRNIYKGHRYVPLIDGEWDKNKSYEGLTVVTHQGNSYTSKKHVPVGIDILDEEYWVVTGNYNAQIEHYRQEVRDMHEQVDSKADTDYVNNMINNVNNEIDNVNQQLAQTIDYLSDVLVDVTKPPEGFEPVVGDGITDNAPALQAILDNFKNIYIPRGTYLYGERLNVYENTTIRGEGKEYTTLQATFKNRSGILINNGESNIIIEKIHLKGTESDSGRNEHAGIEVRELSENVIIRDNKISGFNEGAGVRFAQGEVDLESPPDTWVFSPTMNCQAINNEIINCYMGLESMGSSHVIFEGNRLDDIIWRGIRILNSNSPRIINNIVNMSGGRNLSIEAFNGIPLHGTSNAIVEGNIFEDSKTANIRISDSYNVLVRNNVMRKKYYSETGWHYAIELFGSASKNIVIKDNIYRGDVGFLNTQIDSVVVINNTIETLESSVCILLDKIQKAIIKNNKIKSKVAIEVEESSHLNISENVFDTTNSTIRFTVGNSTGNTITNNTFNGVGDVAGIENRGRIVENTIVTQNIFNIYDGVNFLSDETIGSSFYFEGNIHTGDGQSVRNGDRNTPPVTF